MSEKKVYRDVISAIIEAVQQSFKSDTTIYYTAKGIAQRAFIFGLYKGNKNSTMENFCTFHKVRIFFHDKIISFNFSPFYLFFKILPTDFFPLLNSRIFYGNKEAFSAYILHRFDERTGIPREFKASRVCIFDLKTAVTYLKKEKGIAFEYEKDAVNYIKDDKPFIFENVLEVVFNGDFRLKEGLYLNSDNFFLFDTVFVEKKRIFVYYLSQKKRKIDALGDAQLIKITEKLLGKYVVNVEDSKVKRYRNMALFYNAAPGS